MGPKKIGIVVSRYFRALVFVCFNLEVVFNVGVSLLSTYLTSKQQWDIRYRLDSFFISLAIITPLMTIITTAFARRERAATTMAALKSNTMTFYMMHRDQHKAPPGSLETVGDNNAQHAREMGELLEGFLESVDRYLLREDHVHESQAELMIAYLPFGNWLLALLRNKVNFRILRKKGSRQARSLRKEKDLVSKNVYEVYERLTEIGMYNERVIVNWGYTKPGENAPPGRSNTLLGAITQAFESLRLIHDYRLPVMLRYSVRVLLYIYAIFMGPYFNDTCTPFESYEKGKAERIKGYVPKMCYVNYLCAALFVMSVTMLMRIGRDIEYPFDMQGLDDLFFEGAQELKAFRRVHVPEDFRRFIMTGSKPDMPVVQKVELKTEKPKTKTDDAEMGDAMAM